MKLVMLLAAIMIMSGQVWASNNSCLEVSGIKDYGDGSAYIELPKPWSNDGYDIEKIIQYKGAWICRFPEKRLVAMSLVYGNDYKKGIIIRGLLIHYEWRKE